LSARSAFMPCAKLQEAPLPSRPRVNLSTSQSAAVEVSPAAAPAAAAAPPSSSWSRPCSRSSPSHSLAPAVLAPFLLHRSCAPSPPSSPPRPSPRARSVRSPFPSSLLDPRQAVHASHTAQQPVQLQHRPRADPCAPPAAHNDAPKSADEIKYIQSIEEKMYACGPKIEKYRALRKRAVSLAPSHSRRRSSANLGSTWRRAVLAPPPRASSQEGPVVRNADSCFPRNRHLSSSSAAGRRRPTRRSSSSTPRATTTTRSSRGPSSRP